MKVDQARDDPDKVKQAASRLEKVKLEAFGPTCVRRNEREEVPQCHCRQVHYLSGALQAQCEMRSFDKQVCA